MYDDPIVNNNLGIIKEFQDYVSYNHKSKCKINHPILDRFYQQQIVQKCKTFNRIKPYINKDSKILDISTGMGFFPLICLLSGYKNIEYSEKDKRGDDDRAIIYQNGYDWLYKHFKTEPFLLKFFKNKPCQLSKKYDIITCIGAGFLNFFSGEETDFFINDILKYTNVFYLRTNHSDRSKRKLNLDSKMLPFEYYPSVHWRSKTYESKCKLTWSAQGRYIYVNE